VPSLATMIDDVVVSLATASYSPTGVATVTLFDEADEPEHVILVPSILPDGAVGEGGREPTLSDLQRVAREKIAELAAPGMKP